MERRKFVVGLGSLAAGGAAAIGTGAFSRVGSERAVSVDAINDKNAYLGLTEVSDSPNASYVSEDGDGHLQIQMDGNNPTDAGGSGVNSDSKTVFKDLFKIINQGKQKIHVFVFKLGNKPGRVGIFTDSYTPCWGNTLGTGKSITLGLETYTHGLSAQERTELLENVYIVAIGEDNPEDGDYQSTAAEMVPDEATPNDSLPSE